VYVLVVWLAGIGQMVSAVKKWVLLDEEGEVVRRFDHPAPGTVEVVVKKLTYKEMMEICGEAPF
jgi:hypothetical protein